MKLTVGPLPAGVYWRRRAIVGGVVLIAVLMLWASCGGGNDPADKTRVAASGAVTPTATATPTSAAPTVTIQVPTTGEPTSAAAAPTSAAAPTGTTPPCADADLTLTAAAQQAVQFRGAYLEFTLKIKNVSPRDCVRDLGADGQELFLAVGAAKVWSSDDCDAPHGSKPTVPNPGIEQAFSTTWNGKASDKGCTNREVPPAGKYQLVGRLQTKMTEPVQIQLT